LTFYASARLPDRRKKVSTRKVCSDGKSRITKCAEEPFFDSKRFMGWPDQALSRDKDLSRKLSRLVARQESDMVSSFEFQVSSFGLKARHLPET
jgi:hypothetical protein